MTRCEIQAALVILLKERHLIKNEDEAVAAVTHWLQAQGKIIPPLLNKKAITACLALFKHEPASPSKVKEDYQQCLAFDYSDVPYPPPEIWNFTFIDLFAGIGGFRIAFQNVGGRCVFSSEWDIHAKRTYEANFGEVPYGDIRLIKKTEIPDHDVLCAGFPCQPFSLAGVSKKNSLGRKHGFADETQGTLFFEIREILRIKRPKAFMLENVKNLLTHDNGKTFEIIRHSLEDDLKYVVAWQVVDGANWVPQHRERVFLVGYNPEQVDIAKEEINIPKKPKGRYKYPRLRRIISASAPEYTVGPGTWATLERHKAHHQAEGNGFGYSVIKVPVAQDTIVRTISARYHKDGAEVLIEQPGNRPRRLTEEEAMQLQGLDPRKFRFPVSQTQAYRQIGNSVVVPAIQACAHEIAHVLSELNK